ncbi:MAG TPA: MBL fold metallo-hydrolase [Nitrososphaerales archaeon]|nr:MBL fold metallo-hydrolase [Nitrososphaerales archaeon]
MEVKVLGAARQVGRSAFLVTHRDSKILLDYGAMTTKVPGFPMHVPPKDIKGLILSHAHLDHSGAAPINFLSGNMKLHSTPVTSELSNLLIQDFIKISGQYLPFEFLDLMAMNSNTVNHGYMEPFQVGDFNITFYDAGHIPGSAVIAVEAGNKRLLYTGDINGDETNLLAGSWKNLGEADMVITESTYATADHPHRSKAEAEFVDFAKEVVERGGVLLVPAFSVGRAQEIAMTLVKAGFRHPIAMDGMALKVNGILLRYQEYLRDPTALRRTLETMEEVTSWTQRRRLIKKPGVIISPAGMLVGGASIFYNEHLSMDEKNGISIVSFQVPGTPGRTLIDKGLTIYRGKPTKVKAEVRRFDFSSHSGKSMLLSDLKGIGGSPKFLTVHGEEESCISLAQQLHTDFGVEATAAIAGQEFAA